ncbi:MAG: ankyrin repeat domain-containing protein, partial [Verrucomicrobiota bacterium]
TETDYIESNITLFGRAKVKEGRLSPIFFAAQSGNSQLIEYLVSKRAKVNARSAFGATPLMYAVNNNQLEATKTLIALGADVNATMDEDLAASPELANAGLGNYEEISTAYRRAKKNGNEEILDVLRKAGARP